MKLTHADEAVQRLEGQIAGTVITRDDPDYGQRARGWDLTVEHRPALILAARGAADVAAGVRFARDAKLGVAMKSTGHGTLYPADDRSIMLDTSDMAGVDVDGEHRRARVEAGAIWQHVLDRAAPLGLAPPLGSSPHVGVVGYMLGGGLGWLSRSHGFGADSVRWIDVVTADGVARRASPTENSDLFWGLRGGGGSFGAVTAMELDLYPMATIYGGDLVYPSDLARDALRFFRDWIETVPDELTSSIGIMKYPPLPQVSEPLRGKTLITLWAVYAGERQSGEPFIRRWLDWQPPMANTFRHMPFSDIASVTDDPSAPAAFYGSSDMLDALSDEAIDVIVRYATDDTSPIITNMLRHVGGAIARIPADTNAVCHRDAKLYFMIGGAVPTARAREAVEAYSEGYRAALRPHLRRGLWMNFMGGNGSGAAERIEEAYYPDVYARLRALKAKVDPDDLFRFGHPLRA